MISDHHEDGTGSISLEVEPVDRMARAGRIGHLLDGCAAIPSLPSACIRLRQVLRDPYTSSADYARIIEEDAGLTVRVLRLVNSAMYGTGSKVDSLVQAIAMLGVNPLNDLVLATSTVSAFDDVADDLIDMNAFWKHSLGTAVAARAIGVATGMENVEPLFVAGLLHDVGRVVVCIADPDAARLAQARARDVGESLFEAEANEIGFDHAQVGECLLRHWGLPTSLSEPVGYHHHPDGADEFARETAVVHLADITAHAMHLGSSGEPCVPVLQEAAWEFIGDGTFSVPDLLGDIAIQYQMAAQAVLQ